MMVPLRLDAAATTGGVTSTCEAAPRLVEQAHHSDSGAAVRAAQPEWRRCSSFEPRALYSAARVACACVTPLSQAPLPCSSAETGTRFASANNHESAPRRPQIRSSSIARRPAPIIQHVRGQRPGKPAASPTLAAPTRTKRVHRSAPSPICAYTLAAARRGRQWRSFGRWLSSG